MFTILVCLDLPFLHVQWETWSSLLHCCPSTPARARSVLPSLFPESECDGPALLSDPPPLPTASRAKGKLLTLAFQTFVAMRAFLVSAFPPQVPHTSQGPHAGK